MLRKKKLNLRKRLLSMLLAFALLPGSVPGALSAAAEMPDSNAKSETVTGTDAVDGK